MKTALQRALRAAGIRFVRVITCSTSNVIRGKAASVDTLDDLVEHGVGVTAALPALPVMYDAVVAGSGLGPAGEVRLVPDWDTFQVIPYAPGHAQAIGDLLLDGRPWALDPRDLLRRMAARARGQGLEMRAGYEVEFYLLDEQGRPADDTVFASTAGMDAVHPAIARIVDVLAAQGIPVQQMYPEAGPGQYELPLGPADALGAADRMVLARQTIRAVARQAGFNAALLPKVFEHNAGNGAHCHLSLWRSGRNVTGDPELPHGLSAEASCFIAGVLDHLPGLAALTIASCNSYRRVQPRMWSGAFRAWGIDNREAAVRLPSGPGRTPPGHFEIKTSDASSNPYLALGGIIAAGLDGVARRLALPDPVRDDPADLPEAERRRRGIDQLPGTLDAALAALEADPVLLDALGPQLAQAYLAVKRFECRALQDLSLADEVKLLLARY